MGGVGEDVGVLRGEVAGEVAGVEDVGELGAAVLAVGAEIAVEFVEGGESRVGGGALVRVGGLEGDAHFVAVGGGAFEDGEEMRCQHHVARVVERQVAVDARVFGELVGHDPAAGVENQDVEAVGLIADLLAGFGDGFPVGEVALQSGDLFGCFFAELLLDVADGAVDGCFGHGEDEESG